ncbi:MAG: hypothetical protein DRJ60_01675 [Thermoprotei archaeon]|nr:MAG: hypothetical protein DRJ60_01675 [Thermoprotei archaeon]
MKLMEIAFPRDLFEGLLQLAKDNHPHEIFLLLRGRMEKMTAYVEEFIFPIGTTFGLGFSGFSPYSLPLDPSIIGSVHSHPSGLPRPSIQDLHSFFGVIMVIVAYPYDLTSTAAYHKSGRMLKIRVI